MKITIYGLTITSSWGNGHATTYRSLCKALHRRGHTLDFVEKDVEWYRSNRDLPEPDFCKVHLYNEWETDAKRMESLSNDADAIVIGSYFPDGIALARSLFASANKQVYFYDIDTPITMNALRREGRSDYLEGAMVPFFAGYLSFTGGPLLRELECTFGARRAHAFYCSVDADMYRPVRPQAQYTADLSYLGTYAEDRQAGLTKLLLDVARSEPTQRFLVAGSQYPETMAWGANVQRFIHVSPQDHPAFYSSSRFSLNLTRAEMVAAGWSPSVRLFEASACGAALISDSWPGLETFLLPGEEILLPDSTRDVATLIRDYGEADRIRIGARARERILAEHSSLHRAEQFEAIVNAG